MAKQGMKRPQIQAGPLRNTAFVPAIQGKAKSGKVKAKPIIAATMGAEQKVWHEKPIAGPYDTELAKENLENDTPFADLQDQ